MAAIFQNGHHRFRLFFVPVAKQVRILPQVTKYNFLWIGNVVTVQTQ